VVLVVFTLVVVAAVLASLIALLGPIASVATPTDKDRAAALNGTRQVFLIAIGGLVAVTGLAFTGRSFYLSRRGQLTDRYGKAIGYLASEKMTERLGGIYALEHLMRESVRDHDTVVECSPHSLGSGPDLETMSRPSGAPRHRPIL
jgi:hypothetical protein